MGPYIIQVYMPSSSSKLRTILKHKLIHIVQHHPLFTNIMGPRLDHLSSLQSQIHIYISFFFFEKHIYISKNNKSRTQFNKQINKTHS